jgi:hypothetical protein
MMASGANGSFVRFGCSDFDHTMGAGLCLDISRRDDTFGGWRILGLGGRCWVRFFVGFEGASTPGLTPVRPPVRPRFGLAFGFYKCFVCFRDWIRIRNFLIFGC